MFIYVIHTFFFSKPNYFTTSQVQIHEHGGAFASHPIIFG